MFQCMHNKYLTFSEPQVLLCTHREAAATNYIPQLLPTLFLRQGLSQLSDQLDWLASKLQGSPTSTPPLARQL